ncbi:hypothetical protein MVEN_01973700 [Mycena venus]|uniref:Uncharacterized protein n=1 Tax=Mycena venus TaxID=2733690 RepID=A0A8H6XEI7_9AGAR|nr:hypothetical protein MVEN_01973700 [Mycena venus]
MPATAREDKSNKASKADGFDSDKIGEREAERLPRGSESPPEAAGDSERSERHFVSINGKPFYVPVMTVDEFCRQYHLSENIRQRLEEEEFKTAGALLEVAETTLQGAGFKSGQIADLKKALKEFLMTNISLEATENKR